MNLLSYFLHFSCEVYKSCNECLHVMKLRCSDLRQNLHRESHIVPTDIITVLSALLTFHLKVAVRQFVRLSAQNYPIDRLSPNFVRLKVLQNLTLYVNPVPFIYNISPCTR